MLCYNETMFTIKRNPTDPHVPHTYPYLLVCVTVTGAVNVILLVVVQWVSGCDNILISEVCLLNKIV